MKLIPLLVWQYCLAFGGGGVCFCITSLLPVFTVLVLFVYLMCFIHVNSSQDCVQNSVQLCLSIIFLPVPT